MYAPTSIVVVLLAGALTGCAGVVRVDSAFQPQRDGYDIDYREASSQRELPSDNHTAGGECDSAGGDDSESSVIPIELPTMGWFGVDSDGFVFWEYQGLYPMVSSRWVGLHCSRGILPRFPIPDGHMVVPSSVWAGDSVPRVEAVVEPPKSQDKTIYYLCGLIVVCALIIAVLTW